MCSICDILERNIYFKYHSEISTGKKQPQMGKIYQGFGYPYARDTMTAVECLQFFVYENLLGSITCYRTTA